MRPLIFILLLSTSGDAAAAEPSPLDLAAHLSPAGLDFVASELPRLLPRVVEADGFTQQLVNCPFTDSDTDLRVDKIKVGVTVSSLSLQPSSGRITVQVRATVVGLAPFTVTRPYACVGYPMECTAGFEVKDAGATVSFSPRLEDGKVRLGDPALQLAVSKDQVTVDVSSCTLVGLILPLFKGYLVEQAKQSVQAIVLEQVPPRVEQLLSSFAQVTGEVPGFSASAALRSLAADDAGLTVGADVQLTPSGQPSCPLPEASPPAPSSARTAFGPQPEHLALSLSRAALERAVLAAWRAGLLCADTGKLRTLGAPAELPPLGATLIGLESGATLALHVHQAPRVELLPGDGARAQLVLKEVSLVIDGQGQAGKTRVTATLPVSVGVRLRLEPTTRSVVLDLLSLQLGAPTLSATDATGLRLQPALLGGLIKGIIAPVLQQRLSGLEVVPQVLHESGGLLDPYFLYLARGETTADELTLFASLFRRPDWDEAAPATRLTGALPQLTGDATVVLRAEGSDDRTPAELLRFRWRVNGGAWSEPGYAPTRTLALAEGTNRVEVAALDQNGNADETPAVHEVTRDSTLGPGKGDAVAYTDLPDTAAEGGCAVGHAPGSAGAIGPLLLALVALGRLRARRR